MSKGWENQSREFRNLMNIQNFNLKRFGENRFISILFEERIQSLDKKTI